MINLIKAFDIAKANNRSNKINENTYCSSYKNGFIFEMDDPTYWLFISDDEIRVIDRNALLGGSFFIEDPNERAKCEKEFDMVEKAIKLSKPVKELLKTNKEAS